jgi:hypothetical protein
MWKLFRKLGFRFMDELSFEPSPVARCAAGLFRVEGRAARLKDVLSTRP